MSDLLEANRHASDAPLGNRRWEVALVAFCLAAVVASLMVVGAVSNTLRLHAVQVVPLLVLLAGLRASPGIAARAAFGALGFWVLIMALIWLFLLGVTDVTSGSLSGVEIALALVIAVCSISGILKCVASPRHLTITGRALAIPAGLVVQAAFVPRATGFLND